MEFTAFFSDVGVPKTGLTPSISFVDIATGLVDDSGSMSEVSAGNAPGWYNYDFTTYDETIDYAVSADGGGSLGNNDRYKYGHNDLGQVTSAQTIAQADLDDPAQYKADVSALAIEANVEGHAGDALTAYDPPTRAEATSDKDEVIAEVDANEVKIDALQVDVSFIKQIESGRWHITGNQMIFYEDDNTTEIARFDLFDAGGSPSQINVFQRTKV